MITILFLYRPVAWCFLRGMKYFSIFMVGVALLVGGCLKKVESPDNGVPKVEATTPDELEKTEQANQNLHINQLLFR